MNDTHNTQQQDHAASEHQEAWGEGCQRILAQQEKITAEGRAGGDRIVATVNLKGDLMHLKAAPELWTEPHEVILELIRSAVRQASLHAKQKGQRMMAQAMVEAMGQTATEEH